MTMTLKSLPPLPRAPPGNRRGVCVVGDEYSGQGGLRGRVTLRGIGSWYIGGNSSGTAHVAAEHPVGGLVVSPH